MGPMNTNPDMPTEHSGDELALEPANSLWAIWSPLNILGLILVLVVGNTILQGIFYLLTGDLFLPALIGALGGVLAPLYFLTRRLGLPYRYDFSLGLSQPLVLLTAGLIALAALAPTSLLAQLNLLLKQPSAQWLALMEEALPTGALATALTILTVVVVAPLVEELVFRGLLHRLASRQWGPWAATSLSSLVFGLIHGEPWYLFGLVGIGVVLALVYEATGSVLACWVTHMVHNAVSLGMMLWSDQPTTETVPVTTTDVVISAGSLVFVVLLFVFLFRIHRPTRIRQSPDQG